MKLVELNAQSADFRIVLVVGQGKSAAHQLRQKPQNKSAIAAPLLLIAPIDVGVGQWQTKFEHFGMLKIVADDGRERRVAFERIGEFVGHRGEFGWFKLWVMENDDIIENFGALPADERARLVAQQQANEWAAIERMKEKRLKLAAQNEELRALLKRRQAFVEKLVALREEIRAENEAFERESERILAA